MKRLWKIFVRVLRSYSVEEKVVSVIVCGIVVFTVAQIVVGFFNAVPVVLSDGKVYTEGLISNNPVIINPLYVDFNGSERDISSLVFSGLSKYDPSKNAFVDDLAVLTVSQDKMTYHFTMKPNLLWQDGQPLTADDVYFTFHDLIQSPLFKNPVLKANFDGVVIQEIDPQNIEFKLKTPNAFFITNMNVGILPKHILGQTTVDQLPTAQFNVHPIGSGPYFVSAPVQIFDDGREKVSLKVSPNYYGNHPKISEIHFNIYPDFDTLKLEIGTLDIIDKVPTENLADIQQLNRFKSLSYELPQYTAVFFNMNNPVLKKDKVRVGLMKAIDTRQLLQQFTDVAAVNTPLLDLNQQDWIYKPNLQEAEGALFDAGYSVGKTNTQQLRTDNKGNPLHFVLLARAYDDGSSLAVETQKTVDFLKNQWGQLGVSIDAQIVDSDTYMQRLQARDYDMVLAGQSLGYNLDTYSYWHSSQATANGLNLSDYKSFAADQIIEKIRGTFDPAQKDTYLKQLAQTIANDVPAIFLYRPVYDFVTDGKVQGISLANLAFSSDRFANISQWCVSCQ
jgi:peptide/nickel transport system substrate-binding protein